MIPDDLTYRRIVEAVPEGIWIVDPQGQTLFCNERMAEILGCDLESLTRGSCFDCVFPEDLANAQHQFARSIANGPPFDFRLRRGDGTPVWVGISCKPMTDESGAVVGLLGLFTDITERKRAQEEALAAQQLESLGRLARSVAHDFNNILGGILATAELALAEREAGSHDDESLLRIRTAAIRGGEIVRQLLTYGGKVSQDFEAIDLSPLVGEMLRLLNISIARRVTIETDLGRGLPAVHANPAQIRQVVMNLLTNASEAIGDRDGVIRIRTAQARLGLNPRLEGAEDLPAGDYVRLEVSDTGSGMTPEVQARIFDPFFTTKSTGYGLGLAAVQGIVRAHGGAISVTSTFCQGTRFEILLPCAQTVQTSPGAAAPVSPDEVRGVTGTVLVVEDDDTLRRAVTKMLRAKGFFVIEADDGHAAVDSFQANEADLAVVLLDITLPGLSGPEVFAELRLIRPDVKVILTTAYDQESALRSVSGQKAWAFIRKPYQLHELVKLISAACTRAQRKSDQAASGNQAV